MTDEELIQQYIEKHGVTKIPQGKSGLPELRWDEQSSKAGELRPVKPDGTFYTRPESLRMLARKKRANYLAYTLGQKIKRAEQA